MFSTQIAYMTGRTTDLSMEEVFGILSGQNLIKTKVISLPPVLPKGGEVYVYRSCSEDPKHQMDFHFDHYRWVSKGSNLHMRRNNIPRVTKRYYYLKHPHGSRKQSLTGFKRHVYCLRESTELRKLYVIHYIGNECLDLPLINGNANAGSPSRLCVQTRKRKMSRSEDSLLCLKDSWKMYRYLFGAVPGGPSSKGVAVDCPRNVNENVGQRLHWKKQMSNEQCACFECRMRVLVRAVELAQSEMTQQVSYGSQLGVGKCLETGGRGGLGRE